jgi:hypothetical protein
MILEFEMTFLNKSCEDGLLINKFDDLECLILHMHPDDLKAIWICHECRKVFVFHSDIEDHERLTAHKMIEKVKMAISSTETLN